MNTDPKNYAKTGYCFFPEVFSPDEMAEMRRVLALATRAGFADLPRFYSEPHTMDVSWLKVCTDSRLLDTVESILGPNLILAFSSMFIKPPKDDHAVSWHQDNTYWGAVHGTDVATVWLALDDVDGDTAPMKVIPCSHAGHRQLETTPAGEKQFLGAKVDVTRDQEACAVSLVMRAGSLSIHDSHLIHGGGVNRSDRRRAGYTIRFCSTDTAWVDLEIHPIPVYLVRGERGSKGSGYIDLRP